MVVPAPHHPCHCHRQTGSGCLYQDSRYDIDTPPHTIRLGYKALLSDDHRVLVPPACGAALAGLYTPSVLQEVADKLPHPLRNVVAIVCGGNGVSLETIQDWKKKYDL